MIQTDIKNAAMDYENRHGGEGVRDNFIAGAMWVLDELKNGAREIRELCGVFSRTKDIRS